MEPGQGEAGRIVDGLPAGQAAAVNPGGHSSVPGNAEPEKPGPCNPPGSSHRSSMSRVSGAVIRVVPWLLLVGYTTVLFVAEPQWSDTENLFWVFFVGVAGAIIANSTGVGGGVVFVPVFDWLDVRGILTVTPEQILATSFLIQCFGMTTGSISWLHRIRTRPAEGTGIPHRDFLVIIGLALAAGLPALLMVQYAIPLPEHDVLWWFKVLSMAMGSALLWSVWKDDPTRAERTRLHRRDVVAVLGLGAIGGAATALFSVGIGELLALYLFIRNYPLVTCAASAVIVTAFTVIAGAPYFLLDVDVPWLLLCFAVPGAICGGWLARAFAIKLGPHRLKALAGVWILGSSLYLLATR